MEVDSRRKSHQSGSISSYRFSSAASSPAVKHTKKLRRPEDLTPDEQAKRDKRLLKKEELSREHDKILNEIENHGRGSIDLALKNVYTLGHVSRFHKKLEKRIRSQEKEIERMCGFHYSNFVEAITELSGIEGDASKLVKKVSATNKDLQILGGSILNKHSEILRLRYQQSNINKTISRLTSILPVLLEMKTLDMKMKLGKYYTALKIIQIIRHEHLDNCKHFHFSSIIARKFDEYNLQIAKTSENEFKNYLENVQANSTTVGIIILKRYSDHPNRNNGKAYWKNEDQNEMPEADRNPFYSDDDSRSEFGTMSELSHFTNTESGMPSVFENAHSEVGTLIQDVIDFKPIYKCLHIHCLLGDREEFIRQYRVDREEQAQLLFAIPKNYKNFPAAFQDFLANILGFFAVEDFIHHSTRMAGEKCPEIEHMSRLVTRPWLEKLLTTAVSRVIVLIRTQFSDDCRQLSETKKLVQSLCKSLESYGFFKGVKDIQAVVPEICKQYNQGLLKLYGDIFTTSISDGSLLPFKIYSAEEEETFSSFSYAQHLMKKQDKYPKTLPFSKSVVVIHQLLLKFIASAHEYCHDFMPNNQNEVAIQLCRSVESLLHRNLRTVMEQTICKQNAEKLALSQVLQFITNLRHMEKSIHDIEEYILTLSQGKSSSTVGTRAQRKVREIGAQLFSDVRRQAETIINPKINSELDVKVNQKFDWAMKEAIGITSPYLRDAYSFLDKIFDHLKEMDMNESVIRDTYFGTYQHIGFSFLEKVVDERIATVNMGAMHQMSLDILYCLGRIDQAGDNLTKDMRENLDMVYGEVFQLVNLFIEWDWEGYFKNFGREDSKYALVNPAIALKLIEKLRQDKKNKNILSSLNISKRKKAKVQDSIVKQLRELIKDWSLLTVPRVGFSPNKSYIRDP